MLLERGGRLLMLRRSADAAYAAGLLSIVSPAKHSALVWVDPSVPSTDLVAYTWAGLRAYQEGASFAIHFQRAGSPVHYHPQYADELRLLA